MKKALTFTIGLCLLASISYAKVSSQDTNLNVIAPGKALYGKTYAGAGVRLIEVDSSGYVEIDKGAVGTSFSGNLTIDGGLIVDDFIELDPATTIDTSATTDATLTPVGSYQIIDTHLDGATCTVNQVTTANIAIGTVVIFNTAAAARDVVFIETGNLDLGGTRTLSDPVDVLMIQKTGANQWRELSFVDNN